MSKHLLRCRFFSLACLFILLTVIFPTIQSDAEAKNPGRVSGIVLDSNGDPVIGTEVTLTPTSLIRNPDETKTNKKGKYIFRDLVLGTYNVSLSEECYANAGLQSQQVELTAETPRVTADFILTELTNLGNLAGQVRDKIAKNPLVGATARIIRPKNSGIDSETITDSRGIFRFQCLTAGTRYTIKAEKDGYNSRKRRVTAVEGENKLNFKLLPISTTTTTTGPTTSTTTASSTTTSTTSTSITTTTTTIVSVTGCEPCEGVEQGVTFSKTCRTVTFDIVGESGPREDNLLSTRKGNIETVCGTVLYTNSLNIYCVEIKVRWGFPCIISIDEIKAKRIGAGTPTTTTIPTTTTTVPGATTTTTTSSTTTTTVISGSDFVGSWHAYYSATVTVCAPEIGGCESDTEDGEGCFQAFEDGRIEDYEAMDGTTIIVGGTWVQTGPRTYRVDFDLDDIEDLCELMFSEFGLSCDCTISEAYDLITLANENTMSSGTLYIAGTVSCAGIQFSFTAEETATSGVKIDDCYDIIPLDNQSRHPTGRNALNSMLTNLAQQILSTIRR